MASVSVVFMRILFGTFEHLAPRLAGRMAFRLFARTPNPARASAREKQRIAAARPLMAEAKRHFLANRDGHAVVAYEFAPASVGASPARTALVIHGWHSRADHMTGLIGALRDSGLRVLAIDLPGHGQSPGRHLDMANAVAAVHAAAERFGPFGVIAGHSFGGAVAVNAVAGSIAGIAPVTTEKLALISAPSSLPAVFDAFARMVGLGPKTRAALAVEVERVAGHPLADYVGARQLARLCVPTLVVHAPDDKEVPMREASAYAAAGDHVRLFLADGRGHRRIVSDREVLARIGGFAVGGRRLALVGEGL